VNDSRDAQGIAEEYLRSRGFVERIGSWEGILDNVEGKTLSIRVRLSARFPDILPEIFLANQAELSGRVAHVEKSGKVCIAPATGILVDVDNPVGIVEQSLSRAARIVSDGISGRSRGDLQTEFLAYWGDDAEKLLSICSPEGGARRLVLVHLAPGEGYIPNRLTKLIADSASEARAWIARLGGVAVREEGAFFTPLEFGFDPPGFGEQISVKRARAILREHAIESVNASFNSWLYKTSLPASVIFSLPLNGDEGRALGGLRFGPIASQAAKKSQRGFRVGKVPAAVQLQFAPTEVCKKLVPNRVDAAYLLPRGGASMDMKDKSVAIVGCGAVGSFMAQNFAGVGIGEMRMVDSEDFEAANCHRHVLGAKHIGLNKAKALVLEFEARYPHQRFLFAAKEVQDVLAEKENFLLTADLIVLALGDETLERRLNQSLQMKRTELNPWSET